MFVLYMLPVGLHIVKWWSQNNRRISIFVQINNLQNSCICNLFNTYVVFFVFFRVGVRKRSNTNIKVKKKTNLFIFKHVARVTMQPEQVDPLLTEHV